MLQTVQVFQREFIKRDTPTPLTRLPVDRNTTGQIHLEIIRNLKSKIQNAPISPKISQKSPFAEYYGFFLQD